MLTALALVGAVSIIAGALYFFFGQHGYWVHSDETFWGLIHEKGHWYLELFIGGVEMLVVDLFFGLIVWRSVIKPHIHHDIEHADHQHAVDAEHYDDYPFRLPEARDVLRGTLLEDATIVALYHLERGEVEVSKKVLLDALDKDPLL